MISTVVISILAVVTGLHLIYTIMLTRAYNRSMENIQDIVKDFRKHLVQQQIEKLFGGSVKMMSMEDLVGKEGEVDFDLEGWEPEDKDEETN